VNNVQESAKCNNSYLFQATNENIREFQEAVQKITTEEIANFTSGKFGFLSSVTYF